MIFREACSPGKSDHSACSNCSKDNSITTTWFIPGHSIETFPDQMKAVAEAGHEVSIHGYSHENPISMTPEQEAAVSVPRTRGCIHAEARLL